MDGIKVERDERNGRKELDQGSEEGGGNVGMDGSSVKTITPAARPSFFK